MQAGPQNDSSSAFQKVHQAELVIQNNRSSIANKNDDTTADMIPSAWRAPGWEAAGGGQQIINQSISHLTFPLCRTHQGNQQPLTGEVLRTLGWNESSHTMLSWATSMSKCCSQHLRLHYETMHVACRLSQCQRQSFSSSCRHATSTRRV